MHNKSVISNGCAFSNYTDNWNQFNLLLSLDKQIVKVGSLARQPPTGQRCKSRDLTHSLRNPDSAFLGTSCSSYGIQTLYGRNIFYCVTSEWLRILSLSRGSNDFTYKACVGFLGRHAILVQCANNE